MEELLNIRTYKEFKAATDREVLNQAEGFVRLGYLLRKAKDSEILRDSGYPSVVAFAEGEYGLTETYVSRYIAINKRYSQGGYSPYLKERFKGYGMAKLAEMLTLSDEVVEALPPQLSKAELQEVKREIRKEQEITDLEVMLEQAEDESEGKSKLERWMEIYIRDNKEECNRAKKQLVQLAGAEPEDWVMGFLAPTGIAAKMARIKGEGKLMLTIKSKYLPLELLNLRTNEKEVYSLKDCAAIMERIWMQEDAQEEKEQEPVREGVRNEEERKEEPEEKLAPVQEMAVEKKEETKEETKKESKSPMPEQERKETGENPCAERQMEVEDYPELLPEGYTPSSYIKCHDGSEVEEKAWRKAKALIGKLYEDAAQKDWSLREVYGRAKELVCILEKLWEET